ELRRFEFLTPPAANSVRNFKSKSGTRTIELLVPLCFRSSCQSVLRRITNFGNGALVLGFAWQLIQGTHGQKGSRRCAKASRKRAHGLARLGRHGVHGEGAKARLGKGAGCA